MMPTDRLRDGMALLKAAADTLVARRVRDVTPVTLPAPPRLPAFGADMRPRP